MGSKKHKKNSIKKIKELESVENNNTGKKNSLTKTILAKLGILSQNSAAAENTPPNKIPEENNFDTLAKQNQDQMRSAASATKIANAWRSHRKLREQKGKIVSAKSRSILQQENRTCLHLPGIEGKTETCPVWNQWLEFLDELEMTRLRESSSNEPLSNIQKFGHAAGRIGRGSNSVKDHLWLILDTEHWLELYDIKHRYGANLKIYHDYWLKSTTPENFFDWLDKGEGKDLDLKERPREKLERQKVKYLGKKEREDYEVTFKDGLLIYRKSCEPVHTNPPENFTPFRSSSPTLSTNPQAQDLLATTQTADNNQTSTTLLLHPNHSRAPSPVPSSQGSFLDDEDGVPEKWIYVTDCTGKFYVGKKTKGDFHHSSFLAGGAIGAAGGIKVRNGKLLEINPKSGHYKPSQKHFEALVERLRTEGIDVDSDDVRVVCPNDILERHLMNKFQSKRAVLYENLVKTSEEILAQQKQAQKRQKQE
ncbi:5091_t:CDS:2 [Entrophospora sp. SA101]|nr:3070_t:CDS:2 [Entrophospora sp. SA101]CAJ0756128.1 5732_t:CDS:2 [Entrophospora sp. SA101]CAJ0767990.1 5091_t:CDS:2 [Entrophospora sp. SA101]CAJ0868225.1 8767_t:CDS:2 [Entrophospora sp. SA101]CAJ0920519.1 8101_t:CDS:2 [Entrophospora sp. SA101]